MKLAKSLFQNGMIAPLIRSNRNKVAEIQAKLDLMGPVNLVAIEKHAENEEICFFNERKI